MTDTKNNFERLVAVLNAHQAVAAAQAQPMIATIMKMDERSRDLAIEGILDHDPGDWDGDVGDPTGAPNDVHFLVRHTSNIAVKRAVLESVGDTTMTTKFYAVCDIAHASGFERVATFPFYQLDDKGVEITEPGHQEVLTVFVDRKRGLVLTVETYSYPGQKDGPSANSVYLYFAVKPNNMDEFDLQCSSDLVSPSQPRWQEERREAILRGDVYKYPDDMVVIGRFDAREALLLRIRQIEQQGTLLPIHPPSRYGFNNIYGMGFYTDYHRAEFLGSDGRFDHNAGSAGVKALRDARLAQMPEWFIEMVGKK